MIAALRPPLSPCAPTRSTRAAQAGLALAALMMAADGAEATTTAVLPEEVASRIALSVALRATGQQPGQSAADALVISQAALGAGFEVRRLEYPVSLPEPPAAGSGAHASLIFLSGDARVENGEVTMGGWALADLARAWSAAGPVILLAETCPGEGAASPAASAVPTLPAPPPNGLIALSPGPAGDCSGPRLTEVAATALAGHGTELGAALRAAGFGLAAGADWAGFTAQAGAATTAAAGGGLILGGQIRPLDLTGSTTGAPLIVAAAAPMRSFAGDRAARPTPEGLPEPSVIVGDASPDPDAPAPDPALAAPSLSGQAIGDAAEDRLRLREDDPALFASLIETGAFDPAGADLVGAVQAELQRLGCYRGTIDGEWGAGSRAAVDRFAALDGASLPSREPEIALFRALAGESDLRCPEPVPVVQPRRQPAVTATTPRRAQPAPAATPRQPAAPRAQPAAPRRQPAPTPAAPATPSRRLDPNALGTGVFR